MASENTEGGNLLTCTTTSEVNNKGFQIERATQPSKVAFQTWETIGSVDAQGKAATYEFTDKAPSGGWGLSYYRLKQIDFDGKSTTSKMVSISTKGDNKLKVYPSVSTGILNIETTGTGTDFQIINLLGQQVMSGKTMQTIDVSALPKGAYVFKVGTEQAKFIRQ